MALSPALVWEVRSTGNSGNGGAFRAGAVGTDFSQQDSAQVVYNDLTVDGTNNLKLSSPLNPFQPIHVGNTINISSSTAGWTAGFYEVLSVSGGVATLDRPPAATSTTGGVGKLGGAVDHPATIQTAVVPSNVVWWKQGTYSTQATNFTASHSPIPSAPPTRLRGYGTTRGDGTRVTCTVSGVNTLSTQNGWDIANLDIVGSSGVIPVTLAKYCKISNCKISGTYSGSAINANESCVIFGCEITGGSGSSKAINSLDVGTVILGNHIHDCLNVGILLNFANILVANNLIVNNAGYGIQITANNGGVTILGNTLHNNGGGGIVVAGSPNRIMPILNNILSENVGYGIAFAGTAGLPATPLWDGNAFYANASGTRTNGSDTTVNPQNGISHVNTRDVILTTSPFVDKTAGDFRLNTAAGGGAACRGAGVPSSWPGSTVFSYRDLGMAQHQESPSSGGGGRIIGSGVVLPTRRTG